MSQEDWSRMSAEEQAQYWQQWEAYYNAWQQPSQPSPTPASYADPYMQQQQYQGQPQWQVHCCERIGERVTAFLQVRLRDGPGKEGGAGTVNVALLHGCGSMGGAAFICLEACLSSFFPIF